MIRSIFPVSLALGAALAVAGCGGNSATPVSPAQVAAVEVSLTEAERVAALYVHLPRCPAPAPCSDAATVARLRADALTLDGMFLKLRTSAAADQPAALTALTLALTAYTSSTPRSQ